MLRFVLSRVSFAIAAGQKDSYRSCKLWKSIEDANRAQPLFVIERGRAADHGTCRNVAVGAALRGHDDAVADIAVSGNTHLAGKYDVFPDYCGPGETDLSAKQSVLAHRRAMSDLRQVVDLRTAADTGFADAGAIDAGVGLDFHIILQHRRA